MDNNKIDFLIKINCFISYSVQMDRYKLKESGRTPLTDAALYGRRREIKRLVKNGADINAFDRNYRCALGTACASSNRTSSLKTVRLLLNLGANPNNFDTRIKNTPMRIAIGWFQYSSIETIKLLLDKGADLDQCLHEACYYEYPEIATLALDRGANPNFVLHLALKQNSIPLIKLLLERGADPNFEHNSKHIFTYVRSKEMGEIFLEAGSDIFVVNSSKGYYFQDSLLLSMIWKRLYNRDLDLAKRYAKNSQTFPTDVWKIILLHKRLQQLSNKKYMLKFFGQELKIPGDIMEKNPYLTISRQLSCGFVFDEKSRRYIEMKRKQDEEKIRDFAIRFGLDIYQVSLLINGIFEK